MVEWYLWILLHENCFKKSCQEFYCETRLFQRVQNQRFFAWLIFTLDDIFDLFEGQKGSLVGFWGVSGPLATPPKNRVPRVQEIRPKLTWLGFLDYPVTKVTENA